MNLAQNNYAFIDGQNLYQGAKSAGWEIDYYRLRLYLSAKFSVKKAFLFLGYLKENEGLYKYLRDAGFDIVFKKVSNANNNKVKGNVDVALAVFVMKNLKNFDQAVLVTSDGDFEPLVEELKKQNKLRIVLSVKRDTCSSLLKISAKGNIMFLDDVKHKVSKLKKRPADR